LWLEALSARPRAQALAASDHPAGARAVGRRGWHRRARLRRKACRRLAQRPLRADRRRRTLPADRRARPGRRPDRTLCSGEPAMMHTWHFSEMAYHPAWPELGDSYRVVIPNRLYDPKLGADLYHRYLDEWALCDELGINIMTNEHHATATCADSVCT